MPYAHFFNIIYMHSKFKVYELLEKTYIGIPKYHLPPNLIHPLDSSTVEVL